MSKIKQVMFVCTGNTCRSPMAQYIFNDLSTLLNLGVTAISRGMIGLKERTDYVAPIRQMTPEAIEAVLDYNPNITGMQDHQSLAITLEDIANSDLILTMGENQKYELQHRVFDEYQFNSKMTESDLMKIARIFTLKEYARIPGMQTEIIDRFGAGLIYKNPQFKTKVSDEVIDAMLYARVGDNDIYNIDNQLAQNIYNDCRDEILDCIKVLVEDLKNPLGINNHVFKEIRKNNILREKLRREYNEEYDRIHQYKGNYPNNKSNDTIIPISQASDEYE